MRKYLSVLRLYLLLFSHSVLSNSLWFHGLQYAQLPCPSLWSVICSVVSDSLQTMDHSPPGSSVHGIPQARILEWIVIHFCRGYSQLGIEPKSPALQADSLPSKLQGSCPSLLLFAQTHVHWVSDAIQPSHLLAVPFSSHLQSFPASGSFQMNQFFASDGQSIGALASASVLPMNIQDWLPLGLTGWISLQSKGLSRVFSNTTVQKHQFFGAQLSL